MTSFSDLERKTLSRFEYGEQLRPVRDWLVLLALAGCVFVLSGAWNAWVFYRAWNGEAVGVTTSMPAPVSTSDIEDVQNVFNDRTDEAGRYQHTYQFVDPS